MIKPYRFWLFGEAIRLQNTYRANFSYKKYLQIKILAYLCIRIENTFVKQKINISALLLTCLLFVRMLAIPLVYADYELRKDYIVQNLCENRLRPQLHCDGKCYLAKRLAATDQKETTEKGATFARLLLEIPCYFPNNSFPSLSMDYVALKEKHHFPEYRPTIPSDYIFAILHPPTV